jgi:hypothetical protein
MFLILQLLQPPPNNNTPNPFMPGNSTINSAWNNASANTGFQGAPVGNAMAGGGAQVGTAKTPEEQEAERKKKEQQQAGMAKGFATANKVAGGIGMGAELISGMFGKGNYDMRTGTTKPGYEYKHAEVTGMPLIDTPISAIIGAFRHGQQQRQYSADVAKHDINNAMQQQQMGPNYMASYGSQGQNQFGAPMGAYGMHKNPYAKYGVYKNPYAQYGVYSKPKKKKAQAGVVEQPLERIGGEKSIHNNRIDLNSNFKSEYTNVKDIERGVGMRGAASDLKNRSYRIEDSVIDKTTTGLSDFNAYEQRKGILQSMKGGKSTTLKNSPYSISEFYSPKGQYKAQMFKDGQPVETNRPLTEQDTISVMNDKVTGGTYNSGYLDDFVKGITTPKKPATKKAKKNRNPFLKQR